MACASLLALLPMQTAAAAASAAESAAPPNDTAADEVLLARARAAWNRALDSVGWDRDAPSARAAANEISAEILPLLSAPTAMRVEVLYLLGSIASDTVGAYLRAQASPDLELVRVYLLHHDDPTLLAALLADSRGPGRAPLRSRGGSRAQSPRTGCRASARQHGRSRASDVERERAQCAAFGLPQPRAPDRRVRACRIVGHGRSPSNST